MSSRKEMMASVLAGSPALYDSQGLETPPEMRLLENLSALGAGYGMGGLGGKAVAALAGEALPVMQGLGEAGAIFPKKGVPVEKTFVLGDLTPKDMFTDTEKQYKLWENTAKQYLANEDFQGALRAKWGMLKNYGGN